MLPMAMEAAVVKKLVRDNSAFRLVEDLAVKVGVGAVNAFAPTKREARIELLTIIILQSIWF